MKTASEARPIEPGAFPQREEDASCGPCAEGSVRCDCGSLLARLVPTGVELKCRRCKRTVVLRFQSLSAAG